MSTRVHTTYASGVAMSVMTGAAIEEMFGFDDYEDVDQALVLEDGGNCEALILIGDDDELLAFANDIRERVTRPRFTATFTPQAWVRDNAVDVDPEGDTEWDCTAAFFALDDDYRNDLLTEMDEGSFDNSALDGSDALKDDPNAPEWVREYHGPFSIFVTRTPR